MSHGVNISEVPTGVVPPVSVTTGLPVYTGIAPINAADLTNVNKPKVCNTLKEFVDQFGPVSEDFDNWTLHEAAKAHFELYEVAPIVCINVIDPDNNAHVASATGESHQLIKGKVKLQVYGGPDEPLRGILKDTVVVKNISSVTMTLGTDYTLAFDEDGFLVVTIVTGGALSASSIILVDFDYLDPSGVTADDIIGGYSAGAYSGLEVVKQVYPKLRLVPGLLLAPKWSQVPEVAAQLGVLAASVDGFRCMAVVDLPTDTGTIATYADAAAYKSDNGYDSVDMITCWPKFKNGDAAYHLSTHIACLINVTDAAHQGIPYASPSNKNLIGTAAVNDDGDEILLERSQANQLNAQGIVTAFNGFNGWKSWGNRTGGYPGTTDPKDSFIPIRRMFNWFAATVILTVDRDVDEPGNKRLIDSVLGTIRSLINGLIAAGALVNGKIEFREDENSTTDLADGKIKFHVTLTPPSPAEQIDFTLEYDPNALAALFQ